MPPSKRKRAGQSNVSKAAHVQARAQRAAAAAADNAVLEADEVQSMDEHVELADAGLLHRVAHSRIPFAQPSTLALSVSQAGCRCDRRSVS